MRRFQALLIAAGLAAAPASAVAGPSQDPWSTAHRVERFEWSSTSKGRLGVMVMSLTPALRKHFGADEDRGVLVANVEPGSPAEAAGIVVGDVIVEARGMRVDSASDVLAAIADAKKGQSVTIELVRAGSQRSVQATLSEDPLPSPFDRRWPTIMQWWQDLIHPTTKPSANSLRS